jgi:hypothetical protein
MRLTRFKKLAAKLGGDTSRFLSPGDHVAMRGQELGEISIVITDGKSRS